MEPQQQANSGASDGSAERDFLRMRQVVFERYRAGDHAGALAVARTAAARFPDRNGTTTY